MYLCDIISIKSVIGIGVGAGAYVLTKLAVSSKQDGTGGTGGTGGSLVFSLDDDDDEDDVTDDGCCRVSAE